MRRNSSTRTIDGRRNGVIAPTSETIVEGIRETLVSQPASGHTYWQREEVQGPEIGVLASTLISTLAHKLGKIFNDYSNL
jgi:hypothetical protein